MDLLQLEAGKARYDAFQETAAVAVYSRYIGREAHELLKPHRRKGIVPVITRATELRHPRGVVGIVAAWNYPAVFAAADGFSALVGGNAVVHRPDIQSAYSAIWVRNLAVEAGLPPDLWQILIGPGRVIGSAIIEGSDAVAFTGSTASGRVVASQAAANLAYAALELGGKNPFIVLPDASIPRAVDAVVRACLINAGQTCVGPERILVHSSIRPQFETALVERIERIRVGASLDFKHDMGCLINDAQLRVVSRHVDDAVSKGATVLTGGRALPELGPLFYAPTLLAGVTPEMDVYAEETFGPVLSLYSFDTQDEAVALANNTEYGLHAVVWARRASDGERFAARIAAGTVEVNDGIAATWGSADVLQGGMKASGMGRRNGKYGILRFTEPQSIVAQRLHGLHPPGSMGHEAFTAVMTHSLRAMHRLPR
jgi:succinate-semialdehyde dehydrogenase/glutarate-semialdehyde dehydrogenase